MDARDIDGTRFARDLAPLLYEWLPRQRWFDADRRELTEVVVIRSEVLRRRPTPVLWVPLEVMIDDAPVICQTVLALAEVVPDEVPDAAIVGEIGGPDGPTMVYDALRSHADAEAYVAHVGGGLGSARPESVDDSPWLTTILLAQQRELTLYRRVQAGPHPDVELTATLAANGVEAVRPPAAVWRKNRYDLASLRRNVRRGPTAHDDARASIDQLLARRCAPQENPADVASELEQLGRTVGELHVGLAEAFGTTPGDGDALARHLAARLPRGLDESAAARVAAAYGRLAAADDLGASIRVHGNLDLHAAERVRGRWIVSRFGCNPDSALVFEQQPLSPLCDVAGLLHSITTVAGAGLAAAIERPEGGSTGHDSGPSAAERELGVLTEAWCERMADAVVAGYSSVRGTQRLLPVERISRDALVATFELELRVRDAARRAGRDQELLRLPLDPTDTPPPTRARW